ncbi:3-hydroxyacyl-CoA dehydrogenase family protein [Martelella alba]|uniref:3-hydroxyacyl-CoA dehydrogenase family protein n=1 Tax=Martelella alba TaxID=2590451 RepID=A0ABY2SK22_9HYPH|nr:3-hydroxyacyl-CoA dehydrogenase family protein [Martelella alba]
MSPQRVAVIGAGTMGARIAAVFAAKGFATRLYSRSEASLAKARVLVQSLAPEADIAFTTSLEECLQGADMLSENIAEQVEVKQTLFRQIEERVREDCLLTTNTSSVPIGALASVLHRPQRLIGLHWFNPADVMPMVEVIRGPQTDEHTVARTLALCQRLDKTPVNVNQDVPGFIVNRLQYALLREALHLVTQGVATIDDVDRAVQSTLAPRWSAMGPLKLMDCAGLDTVRNVAAILLPALCNDTGLPDWLLDKVAQGQLGIKSGSGFYPWESEDIARALGRRDEIVRLLTERAPR